MITQTEVTKDLPNKKLTVVRGFAAPIEKVWRAWTEADILDKWWAPRPYRAETRELNFTEGGLWRYAMVGPEGVGNYCEGTFGSIKQGRSFSYSVKFTDADWNEDTSFPVMNFLIEFESAEGGTNVTTTLTFDEEADLQRILELGFAEGFTMAHGNLDELLAEVV
ncbi:SRPBCC family protein [Mucilaginibacter myungsuensis]|uniref:SRPBCC domain-containing protein n=1 Tax=Mucilaginibacter myungsuensis TaxID=649104 RepID=A0A929KX18_9SPHI|nr:SRPBCC domain-containing protein [Mucilaginibacter myungsuensis]MBE9662757.1 SRPBCC domain-containing protein [Mucilaginibacter myungsuensis]MDN3598177.1 SRPBCC domain-containing protein [Mucilaginibacter myungsuensis]